MEPLNLVTQSMLDNFVRSEPRRAQEIIPELVFRLIAASDLQPLEFVCPIQSSIGQGERDVLLRPSTEFPPFFPGWKSFWEIGTGINPGTKATEDYDTRTKKVPLEERQQSTFIFVTPLSGVRDAWVESGKEKWLRKRRERKDWKSVEVLDGTQIVAWLMKFPAVDLWLALQIDQYRPGLRTISQHWLALEKIGDPPPLKPELFLKGRERSSERLKEIIEGTSSSLELRIEAHEPEDFLDFVAATFYSLPSERIAHLAGRCLIVENEECWRWVTTRKLPHLLIAGPDISMGSKWKDLLPLTKENRHTVVYAASPGGVPNWNSVRLSIPTEDDISSCLRDIGHPEERSRRLASRVGRSLQELKAWLQNLSTFPEWVHTSEGAEIRLATIIGEWDGDSAGDREAIENFLGKSYGEWIGSLLAAATRPGTPLNNRSGKWSFSSRFRGWCVLGKQLTNNDLDRFLEFAVGVLTNYDPQVEMEPQQRVAAQMFGERPKYSPRLRHGLAESLALLGSHPKQLSLCTPGKPDAVASIAIKRILDNAAWVRWAELSPVLPLLAEACPDCFLRAVEKAIDGENDVFGSLFAKERTDFPGINHMTGLLWALETLAWHPDHLIRVTLLLGHLAALDPGGSWANRPVNSLGTIFLPWFPQTCASIAKRKVAIEALTSEHPEIAWKLLLYLLPSHHGVTAGSHKPTWREFIPDDYSSGVLVSAYWEQIAIYARLSVKAAASSRQKLTELLDRLPDLPTDAQTEILQQLSANSTLSLPDQERLPIWESLVQLVNKHKKFATAAWAMPKYILDKIDSVANQLVPTDPKFVFRRLFGARDFELMEGTEDFEGQRKKLESRRAAAVGEVFEKGGLKEVFDFAGTVSTPWQVGFALGTIGPMHLESEMFPGRLGTDRGIENAVVRGFIWARLNNGGWEWVSGLSVEAWNEAQKIGFLIALPFQTETWELASRCLGDEDFKYWERAEINPYRERTRLPYAVERLLDVGRPHAAIECLERLVKDEGYRDPSLVIRALNEKFDSKEPETTFNQLAVQELIKWLQKNPSTNADDLYQVEWRYLSLLNRHFGCAPRALATRLSTDPEFFCQIINLVFRSKGDAGDAGEQIADENQRVAAQNGYRLLHEWKQAPGAKDDGSFDEALLSRWFVKVKDICKKAGRLEVALSTIGEVLPYAPPDPSGLWIHRAVAQIVNERDAEMLRSGFRCELFNRRGVHGYTGGAEEKKISLQFREKAEALEACGYHRFAKAIFDLAESYEKDAEHQASHNPYEM